jgi:fibronectin type 3 domain-containing protein
MMSPSSSMTHLIRLGVIGLCLFATQLVRGEETGVESTPPAEPRSMLGWSLSKKSIRLQWEDRSNNEAEFVLERKVHSSTSEFETVATGIKTNTYRDTTVEPGATYTYHVRARNAAGTSTFGEVTVKAGGAPPPPTSVKIPRWDVKAGIVYAKAYPGFMDIEVYQKQGRYYVRDRIKKADYKDPRPRRAYFVDMENVGPSLEEGYPLPVRGGIYQIQCKRWREGNSVWDLQEPDVAMQWVIKPGPLGVAGELFIPDTFKLDTNDWSDQQHKAIPPFEPILGKVTPSYRYNEDQTWADILSRGASHTANEDGPGGPEQTLKTVGNPLDALGQQGFVELTPEQLTEYALQVPPLAFYLTDWEKQPGWHDTPTYWSIDLPDEKILQNYYYFFSEMNRLHPERKNGDYYRALKWNNSFLVDAMASPLLERFIEQTEDPELGTGPAFRPFTYTDGKQHSMREVCRVYTIDWYLKSNIFPDRRQTALYQIYCNIFDTINAKLITPADSTILGFAWFGTDNDLPYRQYLRLEKGWLGYYGRVQQAPWWVMTATYIGHLFGDGFHWCMGPYIWEPDVDGPAEAPLVFGGTGEFGPVYPREPRYNLAYTKLAEYRLKQYESFLTMPRHVPDYSLNGGKSWITPVGNERRDLLEKAEHKQPICFQWDAGGDLVLVFLSWPFADKPEWDVTLRIAPNVERKVTMHRQWPMLRVFSKSKPSYGLK